MKGNEDPDRHVIQLSPLLRLLTHMSVCRMPLHLHVRTPSSLPVVVFVTRCSFLHLPVNSYPVPFLCTTISCISRAASNIPHLFGPARIQMLSLVASPRNTSIK